MVMRGPRFELEAAANGQDHVGTQTVRTESGDVRQVRGVRLRVCGVGMLGQRGRFLRTSSSSTEEVSSIVSLQALLSLRSGVLRVLRR